MEVTLGFFLIIMAAVVGGVAARLLKLPSLVGYIVGGLTFGLFFHKSLGQVSDLTEIGVILLLFTIGIELSFERLSKFFKIAVIGATIQIVLVTAISWSLLKLFGFDVLTSLVLSLGFSLSSTAVVLKILSDRGELETIHGQIMTGWLLVQDLAVIPMMVILPVLGGIGTGGNTWAAIGIALSKALVVVVAAVFLGKLVVPAIIHKVSEINSRELLVLTAVGIALGTAAATSLFGISPALGAFLAGVVISESQENHAILSEVRPLRDLFVALFFVGLGLLIDSSILLFNLSFIILLTLTILVVKILVVTLVSITFGYRGKTSIANAFGLSQVGEFAFIIFTFASTLSIISSESASLGIAVTLISLIVSPFLFKAIVPVWHKVKLFKIFSSGERGLIGKDKEITEHIILCGYGRVGKWIGKVLTEMKVPFVVIEYDRNLISELKGLGIPAIYGDPGEPGILEVANLKNAKAIILAIPDRIAQENLITHVQTTAPNIKIISRAHKQEDVAFLKSLKIHKVVQPEFEAAVAIVRSILSGMGKGRDDISSVVKSLRLSHSK